jgi:hypothetical protein
MALRITYSVLLLVALGAAASAHGGSSATTAVVDRTWSCPMRGSEGLRGLEIYGGTDPGAGQAAFQVSDGLTPGGPTLLIAAPVGILVNRACAPAKSVALGRRGLPGAPVTIISKYECPTKAAKVFVRLRARVVSPRPWRRQSDGDVELKTAVSSVQLAFHAPRGTPMAYVTFAGAKLQMWGSQSCVRS